MSAVFFADECARAASVAADRGIALHAVSGCTDGAPEQDQATGVQPERGDATSSPESRFGPLLVGQEYQIDPGFISYAEIEAHRTIASLLTTRSRRRVSYEYTRDAFAVLVEPFAPRCNCGRVLRVRAEPGRRVQTCACGFRCLELHPSSGR